jgi:hypothetical protein
MCRVHEVLPRSYEVHGVTLDGGSISSGALSSIHCGSLAGQKVAVKSLRNHQEAAQDNITQVSCPAYDHTGNLTSFQMYRAEAVLWRHLHSPHIIPCLGVSDILPLSIVSVWMPGGTIIGWIQQHPHANRASLVSPRTGCILCKISDRIRVISCMASLKASHTCIPSTSSMEISKG